MAHGQPLVAQGYTAITPAVAFSKPWMQSFLKACNGCNVRIIVIHTSYTLVLTILFFLFWTVCAYGCAHLRYRFAVCD